MVDKEKILSEAKSWFREVIAKNHIKNTEKLVNPKEFNINPFLTVYLANFLNNNSNSESIAEALIIPRVLGTSITTSFGQNMQSFLGILKDSFGSTTPGIDIEFIDQIDGLKKFCQLKAGPNTINKDDVETIAEHFNKTIRLGKTNNLTLGFNQLIVGIFCGNNGDLSSHYKRISNQYHFPVYIGQEFWHRLTGDDNFYEELIAAIGSVAVEANFSEELKEVIKALAETDEIKTLAGVDKITT